MSLTVSSLKGKIIAKLIREIQPTGATAFDKIATAIAEAVIEEITTNAVVIPNTVTEDGEVVGMVDSLGAPIVGTGTIS
jgi:hypothetical protein